MILWYYQSLIIRHDSVIWHIMRCGKTPKKDSNGYTWYEKLIRDDKIKSEKCKDYLPSEHKKNYNYYAYLNKEQWVEKLTYSWALSALY